LPTETPLPTETSLPTETPLPTVTPMETPIPSPDGNTAAYDAGLLASIGKVVKLGET
jgi:hypothetical protein